MRERKTLVQKLQTENRKLSQENDNLRVTNTALTEQLDEITKSSKQKTTNKDRKKNIFWYLYDIVVSTVISIFVYWIAINGYDDKPYNFLMILLILILFKWISNKEFHIEMIFRIALNDLLKPFVAMLLGLFLCMFYLGEGWRNARGYAMDVAVMGILILPVILVVIAIFFASCILIRIRNTLSKRKHIKKYH